MKSYKEPCGRSDMAVITNIQHFSVHDGPGIRTTVFFKGCSMHCRWCHNPETIRFGTEIGLDMRKCIGCGACSVCPLRLHTFKNGIHRFERAECIGCGKCAGVCPADAILIYGRQMPVQDIVHECARDNAVFPDYGGVTFSGGECLLQGRQVAAAAAELKKMGIHVCIDTALNVEWQEVEDVLPFTDLFLIDLKAGSENVHRTYTGTGYDRIRKNIKRLSERAKYWIRIPVIHDVNDTEEEIRGMTGFISDLEKPPERIQLLAYHELGESKYRYLGKESDKFSAPDEEQKQMILKRFEETGIKTEWH